jgi:hypothetical protein
MNTRLLIDSIVRQTMVLIAQLSTAAGIRAPLSHVANQVFLDLVTELERQGLGRKVIADMFGLALRSYQEKVQRLGESTTERNVTLWEAVYQYLQQQEVTSRAQVLLRFARDDVRSVRGILNDLVETGLVYRTGRGHETVYRLAAHEDLARALGSARTEADAAIVWVTVYRNGPIGADALGERLGLDAVKLQPLLQRLIDEGRIVRDGSAADAPLRAESCLIQASEPAGWEASVLDHYGAVVGTVCARLAGTAGRAGNSDAVGGSTFSFDVWDGHPYRERVRSLLQKTRADTAALWDEVRAFNTRTDKPEKHDCVTFYFGQNVQAEGTNEEH